MLMLKIAAKKKLWVVTYVVVVCVTSALVCFGSNGFVHLFKMKRELYELTKKNYELTRENTLLLRKIKLFSSNRVLQEEAIRKELGWIKDGEIVIDFPRKSSPAQEMPSEFYHRY
ncbi:MAG: hypothetical protein DRG59_10735 [Deltaproteobacteria bacterium]|nr:MAG: hypothetical protein DRG59_10735 [Deltaproteobacteria bacterium]